MKHPNVFTAQFAAALYPFQVIFIPGREDVGAFLAAGYKRHVLPTTHILSVPIFKTRSPVWLSLDTWMEFTNKLSVSFPIEISAVMCAAEVLFASYV